MIRAERFKKIAEFSAQQDIVSLDRLAELLNVSVATVRRDVDELQEQGIIQKTRGGIIYIHQTEDKEPSLQYRQHVNLEEKRRIAEAALAHLVPNCFCMLDSGSTTQELIKVIPKDMLVTLVTYDLSHAKDLNELEKANIIFLGGQLRNGSMSCHGFYTEYIRDQMSAQIAFLGADSVDLDKGLMGFNTDDVTIKQKMIDSSEETILLCDHSKFSSKGYINIHSFDGIDRVITDEGTDPSIIRDLRKKGITVEVV